MDHLHVRTCRRHTLVYGASVLALSLGLALLYWPPLRHPATLLVLAVALLVRHLAVRRRGVADQSSERVGRDVGVAVRIDLADSAAVEGPASLTREWTGRPAADSRSGVPSAWGDGSTPHSTISAAGPTVPAIAPDSKA